MSFQAYLDNVQAKTGKTAADFVVQARQLGLTKHAEIIAWLKDEYGLGLGHARAIAGVILQAGEPRPGVEDQVGEHFAGKKSGWRPAFDELRAAVQAFGPDVAVAPTSGYLSLVRSGRKFAIVQVTAARLDVGLKLKGVGPRGRLEAAGSWNSLVTHRVRIVDQHEVDDELLGWLRQAYELAG